MFRYSDKPHFTFGVLQKHLSCCRCRLFIFTFRKQQTQVFFYQNVIPWQHKYRGRHRHWLWLGDGECNTSSDWFLRFPAGSMAVFSKDRHISDSHVRIQGHPTNFNIGDRQPCTYVVVAWWLWLLSKYWDWRRADPGDWSGSEWSGTFLQGLEFVLSVA